MAISEAAFSFGKKFYNYGITAYTGKPPREKVIVNTFVIQKHVRNVPDEQSALARV